MAKSLKEALLEQMAALQERGLAPGELPAEQEEEPSYKNYDAETERRSQWGDPEREPRRGGGARAQRTRTRAPAQRQREPRELREPRGVRERRPSRASQENAELPPDLVGPAPAPPPRPSAPRPLMRPGPGQPNLVGPRPTPRSDMLRRNAERLQREQADRNEIQQLLSSYSGGEADDAAVERFFAQLAVETGALPPLNIIVGALQSSGNADPAEVGNQVRLHYRRARARAAPTPVAVS